MFTDCKYTDTWKRWNGLSSVLSTAPMNISDIIIFFLFLSIVFDIFVLFEKKPSKKENLSKEISKQRMISIGSFDQMKFEYKILIFQFFLSIFNSEINKKRGKNIF